MTRPDFIDIAPRISAEPGRADRRTAAIPNTDPYRANQADLSVEWYPMQDAAVALAVFYKDMKSFITDACDDAVSAGRRPRHADRRRARRSGRRNSCSTARSPINQRTNSDGRISGLRSRGHGSRSARASASRPTTRTRTPKRTTAIRFRARRRISSICPAYFENELLSARLSYTYRSDFFVTFDRSTQLNQKALESVDASLVVNVSDNVALTFDAREPDEREDRAVRDARSSGRARSTTTAASTSRASG